MKDQNNYLKEMIKESLIGIGEETNLKLIDKYNTKLKKYFNHLLDNLLINMNPNQAIGFLESIEDDIEEKYIEGFNAEQTISDLKIEFKELYDHYKKLFI